MAVVGSEAVLGTDASSLLQQLGSTFLQLQAHNDASEDKVHWVEIEQHFQNLEADLKKKSEDLEVREKEFEEKKSETCISLAEREAVVLTKEQGSYDRIQELKDAAVAAIAEARANYKPAQLEPVDDGDNKESEVRSSLGDSNALTAPKEKSPHRTGENVEGLTNEVKPCPELTQFCEQMDAKGLMNFALEKRKKNPAFRDGLSIALQSAPEPARLVLDSLEGFYPPVETTQQGDRKDAALQGMRISCVMFMEAMAALLARADPGTENVLNPETKQQAKAIADEWKPKLAGAGSDAANGNSLEAEAFLQLLATFSIASEFDEEELCKLVLAIAHRRQAPELCRSLGLTHKMPGVAQDLINSSKQIDAVHFIHAFQLKESFPPVPILETYLQEAKINSQGKDEDITNAGGGAQDHENAQELTALRAVIRCAQDCKLESEYPLGPLRKRIAELEKAKADKRRGGDHGKQHNRKKARANGGFYGFRGPSVAAPGRQVPVYGNRGSYMGMPERYPHAPPPPNSYNYHITNPPAYAQQVNEQRVNYYGQEERVSATPYDAAAPNYGSYASSAMQPPHQPYM